LGLPILSPLAAPLVLDSFGSPCSPAPLLLCPTTARCQSPIPSAVPLHFNTVSVILHPRHSKILHHPHLEPSQYPVARVPTTPISFSNSLWSIAHRPSDLLNTYTLPVHLLPPALSMLSFWSLASCLVPLSNSQSNLYTYLPAAHHPPPTSHHHPATPLACQPPHHHDIYYSAIIPMACL